VANLQRDIVQIIESINEETTPQTGRAAADPRLTRMKTRLDDIHLKPEKGRRKDLRRIEDLVRSLHKIAFADKKGE
jgi:hypothetical protein